MFCFWRYDIVEVSLEESWGAWLELSLDFCLYWSVFLRIFLDNEKECRGCKPLIILIWSCFNKCCDELLYFVSYESSTKTFLCTKSIIQYSGSYLSLADSFCDCLCCELGFDWIFKRNGVDFWRIGFSVCGLSKRLDGLSFISFFDIK